MPQVINGEFCPPGARLSGADRMKARALDVLAVGAAHRAEDIALRLIHNMGAVCLARSAILLT